MDMPGISLHGPMSPKRWFGGWTLSPAEALKRAMEYAQKEEATGKARGGYHTLMNVIYVHAREV